MRNMFSETEEAMGRRRLVATVALCGAVALGGVAVGEGPARPTDAYLGQTRARWEEAARKIWGFAETSLQEKQSAAYFEDLLQKDGFQVTRGVGALPTAFVASAGSGEPVVALLAEYDALPGLSQEAAVETKRPQAQGAPGHGCGHNLLGTASIAAAV